MDFFNIIAILVTLAGLLSYFNHRFLKMPTTIGLMLVAMLLSLALIGLNQIGLDIKTPAARILSEIDFSKTLLEGLLSYLLFAGALHVNLDDLAAQKRVVGILATAGVVGSTFIVGTAMYWVAGLLGFEIRYLYCLLFGALISPTDPVAVIGIMKSAGAPKSLETKVSGESLFNDGIGVVLFLVLLGLATGEHHLTAGYVAKLFLLEAVGGVLYGLIIGWITYRMLRSVNNYQVEVLLTLALVTGGYALATTIHTSAPIAIVVAGLLIGNHGRRFAMSARTVEHLDTFWELVDEILNAVLFVLIGLEVMIISFSGKVFVAGVIAIPIVLLARFLCVGVAVFALKRFREFTPKAVRILTWAGLRGGISVALALALPPGPERDTLLAVTYVVVVFSIVVQGLTIKRLVRSATTTRKGDPTDYERC